MTRLPPPCAVALLRRAEPRDTLPAARDVAATLDINLHTVLRGHRKLSGEGVIELRRGRRAVVTATGGDRVRLNETALEFLSTARKLGLTETEMLDLIRGLFRAGHEAVPSND